MTVPRPQFGAGSLPPGCGGHCARSRVEGGGGVCRLIPTVPGGGTGPGASAFAVPRRLSVGGKRVAGLAGPRYEPLAADSVALFRHLLPRSGALPLLVLPMRLTPRWPSLSRPVVDVRSIPVNHRDCTAVADPTVPRARTGAACGDPPLVALLSSASLCLAGHGGYGDPLAPTPVPGVSSWWRVDLSPVVPNLAGGPPIQSNPIQ